MGVKDLWKLLEPTGRPVTLESLEGLILAVDVSIWLNQAVKGLRDRHGNMIPQAHLVVLFNRICKLLYYHIKPVFVFDGATPIIKKQTLAARSRKRDIAVQRSLKATDKQMTKFLQAKILEQLYGEGSVSLPSLSLPPSAIPTDMFELPPLPEDALNKEKTPENMSITFDQASVNAYSEEVAALDIHSEEFSSLPSEVQHELLLERQLLEKHSHNDPDTLPQEANNFSSYQLSKLVTQSRTSHKLEEIRKILKSTETASMGLSGEANIHDIETSKILSRESASYILVHGTDMDRVSSQDESVTTEDMAGHSSGTGEENEIDSDRDEPVCDRTSVINRGSRLTDGGCSSFDLNTVSDLSGSSVRPSNDTTLDSKNLPNTFQNDAESPKTSESRVMLERFVLQELKSSGPFTQELKDGGPLSQELNSSGPLSQELKDGGPLSQELKDGGPLSQELKSSEPLSHELKDSEPLTQELKDSGPLSQKLKDSGPLTQELKGGGPLSQELKDGGPLGSLSQTVEKLPNTLTSPPSIVKLLNAKDDIVKDSSIVEVQYQDRIKSVSLSFQMEKPEAVYQTQNEDSFEYQSESDTRNEPHISSPILTVPSPPHVQLLLPDLSCGSELKEQNQEMILVSDTRWEGGKEIEQLVSLPLSEAQKQLGQEVAELEIERARQTRAAASVSNIMYKESQELLSLFGLPYLVAPTEAEAQCACLETSGLTRGSITDDNDVFLFGGKTVYRNFFTQDRDMELFTSAEVESRLGLSRDHLIVLAYLLGSDYTDGLEGVGIVSAMELVRDFPGVGIAPLRKLKEWHEETVVNNQMVKKVGGVLKKLAQTALPVTFPDESVYEAYLSPLVDSSLEEFEWGKPDLDLLRKFASDKIGWDQVKVDSILLPVLKRMNTKPVHQKAITSYMPRTLTPVQKKGISSRRIRNAVARLTNKDMTSHSPTNKQSHNVATRCPKRGRRDSPPSPSPMQSLKTSKRPRNQKSFEEDFEPTSSGFVATSISASSSDSDC